MELSIRAAGFVLVLVVDQHAFIGGGLLESPGSQGSGSFIQRNGARSCEAKSQPAKCCSRDRLARR